MENNKVINQQRYLIVLKRSLPELQHNDPVRIHNDSSWRVKGKIVKKLTSPPRSYLVLTEWGNILRRNRKDLLLILPRQNCPYMKDNCSDYNDQQTNFNQNLCERRNDNNRHQECRTRSGRLVKRPVHYDDFVVSWSNRTT